MTVDQINAPDDSVLRPNEVQKSRDQKRWVTEKRRREDDPAFAEERPKKRSGKTKEVPCRHRHRHRHQAQARAVGWQEAVSPEGRPYYYNPATPALGSPNGTDRRSTWACTWAKVIRRCINFSHDGS